MRCGYVNWNQYSTMSEISSNENQEKSANIFDYAKDEKPENFKKAKETLMILEKFKETVKLWKKIPGFGLILIILKNIIGGASDVVVKKIIGIDPINLVFYRSLGKGYLKHLSFKDKIQQ